MKVNKEKLRGIIQEEIERVISEVSGSVPGEAGQYIKDAQFNVDQARAEMLGTEWEDSDVFDTLSDVDRKLKRLLDKV